MEGGNEDSSFEADLLERAPRCNLFIHDTVTKKVSPSYDALVVRPD